MEDISVDKETYFFDTGHLENRISVVDKKQNKQNEKGAERLGKMSETESSNISYQQHTNARRVDSRNSRLYSQTDEPEDSSICGGLCCKPGLIIGIVSCIYVIIVLPCGLFLMMVGGPKSYILLLIGFGAIFLPLLVFALICVVMVVKRRLRKRAMLHRQMKETPEADFV